MSLETSVTSTWRQPRLQNPKSNLKSHKGYGTFIILVTDLRVYQANIYDIGMCKLKYRLLFRDRRPVKWGGGLIYVRSDKVNNIWKLLYVTGMTRLWFQNETRQSRVVLMSVVRCYAQTNIVGCLLMTFLWRYSKSMRVTMLRNH